MHRIKLYRKKPHPENLLFMLLFVGATYLLAWRDPLADYNHLVAVVQDQTHPKAIELVSQPTPTPTPTPEPTTIVVASKGDKWSEFVVAVDKVAPMYNFPKNVVLAQGALESGRGKSPFAVERNNFLGIGAFDHDPKQAYKFENAEQCVIEYMRTIRKNFPEAWEKRDDSAKLLELLTKNPRGKKYATDPDYTFKVKRMQEWSVK